LLPIKNSSPRKGKVDRPLKEVWDGRGKKPKLYRKQKIRNYKEQSRISKFKTKKYPTPFLQINKKLLPKKGEGGLAPAKRHGTEGVK
jgi:hypothetical protein